MSTIKSSEAWLKTIETGNREEIQEFVDSASDALRLSLDCPVSSPEFAIQDAAADVLSGDQERSARGAKVMAELLVYLDASGATCSAA